MERRKFWLSSIIKNSFFLPTKSKSCRPLNLSKPQINHFYVFTAEKSNGLVAIYKDMESCSGYKDIQVMWEMIHSSSCHRNAHKDRGGNKND
ncbi:hypothetical protein PHJA_002069600 [Phtheirospermum japonicum]|uniref:Uncharacterized protein n=1 Tax=Phtheirospermum japonicum TaxID=374723 RepID=A0A830CES2_9LAMI|nr:hypothetical protein PHJA_002069600 [Phtheirospermum japonicum]